MKMSQNGFETVDEYIGTFAPETQAVLEQLRSTIKNAAPDAREKISYQMTAYELEGKNLIYFAGWKKHISIYPIPSGTEELIQEISPYIYGKGTLRFPIDKPLPLDLIGRIVRARIADI